MWRFLWLWNCPFGSIAFHRVPLGSKSLKDLRNIPFASRGKNLVRNEEAAGSSPAMSTIFSMI
jgi:hypothetical protein